MGVEPRITETRRPLWRSIRRGVMCRCPNCGRGRLFRTYLQVNDRCPVCGEELFHHRADVLPAWFAILVVGFIVIVVMLAMEMSGHEFDFVTYLFALFPPAIVLPILFLPPIKGGVVGLQWANRMHGFDKSSPDPVTPRDFK